MPGRSPSQAIDAFIDPLKSALACVGTGHFTLSPGARGDVGESHSWVLNRGEEPVVVGGGFGLMGRMNFEVLDQGSSRGSERFKVTTRSYLYSVTSDGSEVFAAHWHPTGNSPITFPHWHICAAALGPDGVFPTRSHIPSPRISFEWMVRWTIESLPGVEPTNEDWRTRLQSSEALFDRHKSWGELAP